MKFFRTRADRAQELVARAHQLGYSALAITDDCSVAGVVRAYAQWKELKEEAEKQQQDFSFKLIVGSELIRNSATRWFSAPVDDVLAGANQIAGDYYAERRADIIAESALVSVARACS